MCMRFFSSTGLFFLCITVFEQNYQRNPAIAATDNLQSAVFPLPAASKASFTDHTSRAHITADPDWFTWYPSVTQGDDGKYHMFHSCWTKIPMTLITKSILTGEMPADGLVEYYLTIFERDTMVRWPAEGNLSFITCEKQESLSNVD